jgi:tryptophanyl-tRNA synthetase
VEDYLADPAELNALMRQGAQKARETANQTLAVVYDRVGFVPF